MSRRTLAILVTVGGLAYASCAGGCLRKWRAKREAARLERIAQQEREALAEGESEAGVLPTVLDPTFAVLGEPGLEVAVWTCDDTWYAAARVLEPYADRPVPVSDAQREVWRRHGVRIVAVPASEIDLVAAQSRPLTPVQRQRFGQLTSWSAVVRGPGIPAGTRGPNGEIPAGKPRLIARAWLEPDLSGGELREVVRVEAGVQIETGAGNPWIGGGLGEGPGLRSIGDEGELIEGMLVSFQADGGDAIVLVGEDPGVDWSELPEPIIGGGEAGASSGVGPTGQETGEGQGGSVTGGTRPGGRALGPGTPRLWTVGERMLAAPGSPPRDGRPGTPARKVFVVLIPRVPERAGSPDGTDAGNLSNGAGR